MIRINLLPQKRRARISHLKLELLWAGAILFLVLLGMGGGYYFVHSKIEELTRVKAQREGLKRLAMVRAGKVTKLKKELAVLENNILAIRDIRRQQGLPVRYIDEMITRMPGEKIWLEAFSLDGNGKMDIKGVALDNQAFANYVDELRRSELVKSVVTRRTQLRLIQGLGLVEFQCTISAQPPASRDYDDE